MTDRIHVEDLTTITHPFGLLDDDTQRRLRAWPHGVETFGSGRWIDCIEPAWIKSCTYRAKPAPLIQPSCDWSHVAPWVQAIAWDKNERVYCYKYTPTHGENAWRDTGRYFDAEGIAGLVRGTVPWTEAIIIIRPGVKG